MNKKNNKEELKDLLEKLNSGEEVQQVKEEARDLLNRISPKELSEAEQELIDDGLEETELRHLCEAHIEAMAEELEALKAEVPVGHPLNTLITEHDEILKILDRLEKVNNRIQKMKIYNSDHGIFTQLKDIACNLLETENHHKREEEVLFPEVDATGVTGPTRIMKMEHEDLWPRKEKVDYLANNIDSLDFGDFKKQLNDNTEYIVLTLRDHIFKENHILYPTAKEVIEEERWAGIKKDSDRIGYCSFTPKITKVQ
ncbi:DUF438 domain-containing protein [Orenia marismortui]|uniref:Uncharacterized protein n=1 Tax=Orenia marismortui TaxID=46469 RepID=A0A4R8GYS0_9FIRM|nr:DUF438 domain-containing protein [Orenia marismortui]TDX51653.1 hypothetical protein C7959_11149 [Orenia marismortui]